MPYGGKSNGGSGDGAGRGYDGDVNGDVEPPKNRCIIINLGYQHLLLQGRFLPKAIEKII